jgi:hypothetical protein
MSVKEENGVITVNGDDLMKLKDFAREQLEATRPPEGTPALSTTPTPFAVICTAHGRQFMTSDEYGRQLSRPDSRWTCPKCGEIGQFDDDNYEASLDDESDDAS